MVFLAATNVLGYLVTNKINAVIFFALVSLLTAQFSKNMAVVLLVGIIATNFLMANKRMREGLENQEDTTSTTTPPALGNIENKDQEIAETIQAVQNANANQDVSKNLNNIKNNVSSDVASNGASRTQQNPTVDLNNPELNKTTDSGDVKGVGERVGGKKVANNAGPRLDYAATIEESYANLDTLLGSGGIKNLTKDTKKLMEQQTNLYKTMEQMVPMIEGAKNMLDKLNVNGLTDTLKSMNLGGSSVVPTNK